MSEVPQSPLSCTNQSLSPSVQTSFTYTQMEGKPALVNCVPVRKVTARRALPLYHYGGQESAAAATAPPGTTSLVRHHATH